MDNFEINRLGSQINMLRDVSSAVSASRYFDAVDDINRGMQERAERKRKAEEAAIELNEQTKVQNQLLREQNQKLNETIMQLKIIRQKQRQIAERLDFAKARSEKLEAKAREDVAICETMRKAILKEAFEGSVREAGPYD